MNKLKNILPLKNLVKLIGDYDHTVKGLVFDSRLVSQGDVFFAVKGTQSDGHQFIGNAIQKGALAVVCEELPSHVQEGITYLQVKNVQRALGEMAAEFYQHPSSKLKLIGITGTNGKTTTATILHQIFTQLGYKTGLISTIENRIGTHAFPTNFTTPDVVQLNKLLAEMNSFGCDYAFMEVSSHAVEQGRIAGLHFAGGVFTNISHDHLDFHKTFDNYIKAKKTFFDELPASAFALVNSDDKRGFVMLQNTKAKKSTFGLKKTADWKARILENSLSGLHLELDGQDFHCRLVGEFNAYNIVTIYAVAMLLGVPQTEVLTTLSNAMPAEGRFDCLFAKEKDITAIVDYAHTPDALEKVLTTIHQIKRDKQQVISVFGCGGDRDKTKRPIMAKIGSQWSERVILTSDNPRTESPSDILAEMEVGIPLTQKHKVLSILDRKQAIKTACMLAQRGDVILVAGKGHEKYQDTNGVKTHFDDKEILREFLM